MADRADFAPELGALKSLRPFVFWAQTTLPTVFDDSLSYYEVLTKLTKMVNTMLENEDTNAENIAALAEAYQELEDFTNDYFENLDITQEISDKIDELVDDGTIGGYVVDRATTLVNNYLYGEDGESGVNKDIEDLISDANADITQALTTFGTNSAQAINDFNSSATTALRDFNDDASDALDAIPTTVEEWLEQNFSNPQSPPLDATLSVESSAAQAKATGEAIEGAIAVAMGNSHWNYRITDVDYTNSVLANHDGSNAQVTSEAVGYDHSLHIASVTPGEAYTVSCVGRITGPNKFAPAYAFASLTYDLQDNPVYVIRDIYPRSWDDQTVSYEIVRNKQIIIPNYQTGEPVNTLLLMGFSEIAVTPYCAQLVNNMDTALTSTSLPAQGKATGDALATKLPWPITGGSKDVGSDGDFLCSDGADGTKWIDLSDTFSDITSLQNSVDELDVEISSSVGSIPVSRRTVPQHHYYWNTEGDTAILTPYSGNYYAFNPIEVSVGDKLYGYCANPASSRTSALCFVDEDYNIIQKISTASNYNYNIQAPVGSKYLLATAGSVNAMKDFTCYIDEIPAVAGGNYIFSGKNVAIIGDSISTNGNYSEANPLGNVCEIVIGEDDIGVELSAYVTWWDVYTDEAGTTLTNKTIGGITLIPDMVGTEITFIPTANDVGKTVGVPRNNNPAAYKVWWELCAERLGFNPIPVTWSGASITSHEADVGILKTSYAYHPAQIRKCGIRKPGSMERESPDIVIIYRGVNDFSHTPYCRLTYDLSAYHPEGFPAEDSYDEDGTTRYDFISGYLMTIKAIHEAYPNALIVVSTLNYFKRLASALPGYPTRNGTNTLEQYNNAIRAIADYCGCAVIEFAKDGLNYYNTNEYYMDTTGNYTHPNNLGHIVLGNRAQRDLINNLNNF